MRSKKGALFGAPPLPISMFHVEHGLNIVVAFYLGAQEEQALFIVIVHKCWAKNLP